MSVKSWNITTESGDHRVDLDWSYWGGKRQINVDGKQVAKSTLPLRWGSTQEFEVDGHPCEIRTQPAGKLRLSATFDIHLKVDGQIVEPVTDTSFWETKSKVAA